MLFDTGVGKNGLIAGLFQIDFFSRIGMYQAQVLPTQNNMSALHSFALVL